MIPTIEDIFKMLSEGVISFDQAEAWVRSHVAASEDTQMLRPVFAGLAMNGLLASGLYDGPLGANQGRVRIEQLGGVAAPSVVRVVDLLGRAAGERFGAALALVTWLLVDEVPQEFVAATPYIVTIIVLAGARQQLRPPAHAGQPYRPGESH